VSPTALIASIGRFTLKGSDEGEETWKGGLQRGAMQNIGATRSTSSEKNKFSEAEELAVDNAGAPTQQQLDLLHELQYPEVPVEDLKRSVLTLFRIYTPVKSGAQDNSGLNNFFNVVPGEPNATRRLRSEAAEDRKLQGANWKAEALKLGVTSKAYTNLVLSRLAAREIGPTVLKWFGTNDDQVTRAEIKRVLNGLSKMLTNIEYIYPGEHCTENTYGYVFPASPWNKNPSTDQYITYLCPYYFKVPVGEQVETILHEGSHHHMMATDDSEYEGRTMYGRSLCKKVASDCTASGTVESGPCMKARENADTFCYFINDAGSEPVGTADAGNDFQPQPSQGPDASAAITAPVNGVPTAEAGLFGSLR